MNMISATNKSSSKKSVNAFGTKNSQSDVSSVKSKTRKSRLQRKKTDGDVHNIYLMKSPFSAKSVKTKPKAIVQSDDDDNMSIINSD